MSWLQLPSIAESIHALFVRLATARLRLSLLFFSPAFQYDRENPVDRDKIRLVRLPDITNTSTASSTSQLNLTIHTFRLTECPSYLALSYTWGPSEQGCPPYQPHNRHAIQVNGRRFLVYPSLHEALTQLAISRPGHYIWIDGICINQDDPIERAVQVGIMDVIYSGAEETIIWLGKSNERTTKGIEKIKEMAKGAAEKILEWGTSQTTGSAFVPNDAEQLARSGLPHMTEDEWLDIADVFSRTWFQRVWIIQEVALSRNPTVLIGDLSVPWSALGNVSVLIVGSYASLSVLGMGGGHKFLPLVQGVSLASMLHMLCEWCIGEQSSFSDIFKSMDFATGINTPTHQDLLSLLMASKGFKATLRQDKIYGFLGILNHLAKAKGMPVSNIKVDYMSPADEVLCSLGRDLYQETQSLHLLSHAGEAARRIPSPNPTWIPSFESANLPILSPNYTNIKQYNASRSLPPTLRIVEQPALRLHVEVANPHLGSVEELGEIWDDFSTGHFLKTITMLLHCGDGHTYGPTSQPIVEALWRTLIMDTDTSSRPASNDAVLAPSFKAWFQLTTITALMRARGKTADIFEIFDTLEPLFTLANSRDTTHLLPKSTEMVKLLFSLGFLHDPTVKVMTETERNDMAMKLGSEAAAYETLLRGTFFIARRPVRTVRGYLCLAPNATQIGDKVMIIKGCPTPLVLRRVPEEPDCFKIIGDVYVHGAMFGEHITDNLQWRDINLA